MCFPKDPFHPQNSVFSLGCFFLSYLGFKHYSLNCILQNILALRFDSAALIFLGAAASQYLRAGRQGGSLGFLWRNTRINTALSRCLTLLVLFFSPGITLFPSLHFQKPTSKLSHTCICSSANYRLIITNAFKVSFHSQPQLYFTLS